MKLRPRRCPKCRSIPVRYVEMWCNHGIEFEAKDGIPSAEGYLFEGVPDHVLAKCACGHSWRLRGVYQISDLRP